MGLDEINGMEYQIQYEFSCVGGVVTSLTELSG